MVEELIVMCSGAFIRVLDRLLPELRQDLGIGIRLIQGPSIGMTPRAILMRLRHGEAADLAILFDDAIDGLVADGTLLPHIKTRLATSGIGIAVRRGAPEPEIGTDDELRRALLETSSFAYSASASGIYVSSELLSALGLGCDVASKGVAVEGEPVGAVVAQGGAELGFQQMSELLPINGISVLGPLPAGLQRTNILSAAMPRAARQTKAARSLLMRLSSPQARQVMITNGLSPVLDD